MTDPLNLEPPDGDYVRYIESLQTRGAGALKPLEPEDFIEGTEAPKNSEARLKKLLRTLHIPGTSGEDESRRKALARMEEASRGADQSPAALPAKKAKVDHHCRRRFRRRSPHHLRRFRHSHFSISPAQRPLRLPGAHKRPQKTARRQTLKPPALITFAYFLNRILKRSAFSRADDWTARPWACQSLHHHSLIEAQRG